MSASIWLSVSNVQRAAGSTLQLLAFRRHWQQCLPSPFTSVGGKQLPVSSAFASITTQGSIFMLLGGSGLGALKIELLPPKGCIHR